MIYILDSNAMAYLRANRLNIPDDARCFVPKEIEEEFLGDARNDAWYSECTFIEPDIDLGMYLTDYADILNRYRHISFYSLKGLGDVSILTNASALLKGGRRNGQLFIEPVCIVTGDGGLREFAVAEFTGNFSVLSPSDFAAQQN